MGRSAIGLTALAGIFLLGCDGDPNPLSPLDAVVQANVVVLGGGVCAGDATLETQPDVVAFGALGCTTLQGALRLARNPANPGPPISDLDPLTGLAAASAASAGFRRGRQEVPARDDKQGG